MLSSVLGRRIWERRSGYVWWLAGLVALASITVGFWPTIERDTDALGQLFESLPKGFVSIFGASDVEALFTAAGFINSRIYSSVGAIIVVFFAISMGTHAIAGEEDSRTLDLLLSHPIARRSIVIQSFGAMAAMTAGLALAVLIVLLVADPLVDLDLPLEGMVAANVGMVLLALVFGTLALAVGGATGRRALTMGIAAGATFATFFVNGLAPLIEQIAWTRRLTPFFWVLDPQPLEQGFAWQFLVLAVVIVALLGAAVWSFDRRDVAV